jgi:hypothetical protein
VKQLDESETTVDQPTAESSQPEELSEGICVNE